jgi:hypothetical protein
VPWFQAADIRSRPFEFVIRTQADPSDSVAMIRRAIERLRPDAPILTIRTMTGVLNGRLLTENLLAALGTFFAVVAMILAGIGVYGLLAFLGLRALDGLLFGLSPTDTMNLMVAAGVLVLVALTAGIVPARRAPSVDPLVALRAE